MKEGAPVRFLLLLLGGWVGLRAAILALGGMDGEAQNSAATQSPSSAVAMIDDGVSVPASSLHVRPSEDDGPVAATTMLPFALRLRPMQRRLALIHASEAERSTVAGRYRSRENIVTSMIASESVSPPRSALIANAPSVAADVPAPSRRWTGSIWALARRSGGATLAPGGTLGGSQAGARLLYRINDDAARPLSLTARAYAPLHSLGGTEAALGIDWRPSARLPFHLLIERRQRLGREGRSAFAATAYGGGSAALARNWRIEVYAQAGVVGTRSRDLFVDGSARLMRRLGPVEAGAAVWGAAQPGASRLDAGPQLAMPIHAGGASLRLAADYRFRIAGDARPASGPALTLGVDF